MKNRVFYVMSGPAHLPYLLVSLKTLREHYDGEVVVFAWKESIDIARKIAEDKRLNIEVRLREPAHRSKNAQFMDKIKVAAAQKGEIDCVLYLDADTTIHGSLDFLFNNAYVHGFAATQFNSWLTTQGIPSKRIVKLLKYDGQIDPVLVNECLDKDSRIPSVNGGVWACRPESAVLDDWYNMTEIARSEFIADEVVMHLLAPKFKTTGNYTIVTGNGKFNCSPKFQSKRLHDDDVTIRHYHGDSNVRPQKNQKGYDLWWPIYLECLKENFGNIQQWILDIDNKWMNLLRERSD